ncbi:MAG TPA: thiamine pyrophosphate-dependent enzyme [Acetobacteraceae bacterium]
MARMTGGEAMVDSLIRHGVDTVFGLPGVQTYGLFDALARHSNAIRLIGARHEQGCAYMATGYAVASGKPGVYSVVPGPGVLNTTAALCSAFAINAPVLCLTGQVPSVFLGQGHGHLHELPDQLATLRGLVKWADRIDHVSQVPVLMARAFQEMLSGRTRPVALEMPWEQFTTSAEILPQDPLPLLPNPPPDPAGIAAAVRLIAQAKAPMVFVGGGAVGAQAQVRALAERLGAPVVSFRAGRGVLDDDHPLSLTITAGHLLWPRTDLLIGIGTRLEGPGWRWTPPPPNLKRLRIDIDPAEIRRGRPTVGLVADAAAALDALLAALPGELPPGWPDAVTQAKRDAAEATQKVQPHMDYLRELRKVMPNDSYVVDDVCQSGFAAVFGYPIHRPRGFVTSGYQGTLGAGFPTALGVKVGAGERKVAVLTGDGGFMFAATEMATAVQHGIGLTTILFNNNAFGNVARDQKRQFGGRLSGSRLQNPDFQIFARSFGVPSWRVTSPDAFRSALEAALEEQGPTLVEVVTDIEQEVSPWKFLAPGAFPDD